MNATQVRYAVQDQLIEEAPLGPLVGEGGLKYHSLYKPWELLIDPTQAYGKDADFDLTGTGTVPAPTFASRGGITVATRTASAADNDEARIFPLTASAWGTVLATASGKRQLIETTINLAQITETQFYFGWKLTDTGVVATDANQALFLFDTDNTSNFGPAGSGTLTASANWLLVNSAGGNDVAINSAIPVAASTNYRLGVMIDTDQRARFFINGRLIATAVTAITSGNLLPTMGVASRASAGAAKSFTTRHIRRVCSL